MGCIAPGMTGSGRVTVARSSAVILSGSLFSGLDILPLLSAVGGRRHGSAGCALSVARGIRSLGFWPGLFDSLVWIRSVIPPGNRVQDIDLLFRSHQIDCQERTQNKNQDVRKD